MKIGFLHPGEMGISLAASARNSAQEVYWCDQGRGAATRQRAESQGLTALPTLAALCDTCEVLVAVCPPHAAAAQAAAVRDAGYRGIYADANAIAPHSVQAIGEDMEGAGIDFVDGGIIGLPAWRPGTTWLYLSGGRAAEVAGCFSAGPLETQLLGQEIGRASALKMCFAAKTKGTTALLAAILGSAERLGVREALEQQWERYNPGETVQTHQRIRAVARKAWRFSGEMEEIAATFRAAGLPGEFHQGAADIYQREAGFKDRDDPPVEEILRALLDQGKTNNPEEP